MHQRLVRDGIRMQTGLVVETAEAREVHDFALLFGYGAAAVNPYLALDTVRALADSGEIALDETEAQGRYIHAVEEGLLKVMSKMGISTLQSYRGAQIFEAVGLDRALVERHFTGTPSRIGGVGLAELGARPASATRAASAARGRPGAARIGGGPYQWRRRGEQHKWNPQTIALLQAAVQRANDAALSPSSARLADDETAARSTLRGAARAGAGEASPFPLEEVEPRRVHRQALRHRRDVASAPSAPRRTRRSPSR